MNTITPYSDSSLNTVYNLLFCDDITFYKNSFSGKAAHPWSVLFNDAAPAEELSGIAADKNAESRVRLLAYRQLAVKGSPVTNKELLGVIVEVGMEEGTDTLAAFKDGTARYINHAEKMIVWENNTDKSATIIGQLFADSEKVVAQIGPWTEPRLEAPGTGDIRLSFLVSDGLYFGQGPFSVLQEDAMGGPVIQSALALLQFLTSLQQ